MMLALNQNAIQRGEPPPFSAQEIERNLRLQHDARMADRAEQDQKRQVENDQVQLDEIRKSLGLVSGSNVRGALGTGESERSPG